MQRPFLDRAFGNNKTYVDQGALPVRYGRILSTRLIDMIRYSSIRV
jgi:hypothetical protein